MISYRYEMMERSGLDAITRMLDADKTIRVDDLEAKLIDVAGRLWLGLELEPRSIDPHLAITREEDRKRIAAIINSVMRPTDLSQ
jgi:hypothetical protein